MKIREKLRPISDFPFLTAYLLVIVVFLLAVRLGAF